MDVLVVDDNDVNFIWDAIQKLQLIFHPSVAPFGKFDYNHLQNTINRNRNCTVMF